MGGHTKEEGGLTSDIYTSLNLGGKQQEQNKNRPLQGYSSSSWQPLKISWEAFKNPNAQTIPKTN